MMSIRLFAALLASTLIGAKPEPSSSTPAAWPHRAMLTSLHGHRVAFRVHSLGGEVIITVDGSGHRVDPSASAMIRHLTPRDTIRAETPADFPLDLSKGPVVFVAEGSDSLHLVVGRNPFGSVDQVSANGRRLTVRFVNDRFAIDAR